MSSPNMSVPLENEAIGYIDLVANVHAPQVEWET
jgi:hypothetical protein